MMQTKKTLACDVLVVGGGSAGLQAAIGAAEEGAVVILAEKADTRRSGHGATGNDHFQCYIPEIHGSEEDFLTLFMNDRPGGRGKDMDRILPFVRQSFDMVKRWESWGIPMRPHGYWEFTGHNLPDVLGTHLKYEGLHQKPIITKEALKRGVTLLNRTMMTELICAEDGAICGAVCVDVGGESPAIQIIRCKSVVLCSTRTQRLNGSDRMGWMFNCAGAPNCTGDGIAAAYRVGAVIAGGSITHSAYGGIGASRFMSRGGTRTWVGVHTNIYGEPITRELTTPDWHYGAYDQYLVPQILQESYAKGEPMYMNAMQGSEEDIAYMEWALVHEGNGATLQHLKDEGFDWKRHMVEFNNGASGGGDPGGPDVNALGETNVAGLYAAGEITGNHLPGLSPAVIGGDIAGRAAAVYARRREHTAAENSDTAKQCAQLYTELWERPCTSASPDWREANIAVMQTMTAYCGTGVVSEHLYEAGLQHLRRLQKKLDGLHAANTHEFMRCLEVRSLAVCGELAMLQGQFRKETRTGRGGTVTYTDYPERDPSWDDMISTIQRVDGKVRLERRAIVK